MTTIYLTTYKLSVSKIIVIKIKNLLMKNTIKWKKASTIYPTDHIVSSKARELGTFGFKPQYEEVKNVNMRYIMSNEYMRLWFKERELYQKENYAKQENTQNDGKLKRGFVQRMMTNPKIQTREIPVIKLKRFQNIISKVENRRTVDEKIKICERFQKAIEPRPALERFKPHCSSPTTKASKPRDFTKNTNESNKTEEKAPSKTPCQVILKLASNNVKPGALA